MCVCVCACVRVCACARVRACVPVRVCARMCESVHKFVEKNKLNIDKRFHTIGQGRVHRTRSPVG